MDRVLVRFYLATFAFVLLMAVGFPLVPQHLSITFGASTLLIGIVLGIHGLFQIFLRLPMGDLADRQGRKPSMAATFLLSAGAGLFYMFAPTALWIIPGQVLFGLASGIYWVAANAYLFDRVADEDVPRATSDYAIAIGAAFLVGPPLGGYLADEWGFRAGLSVFLWASLGGLLLVLTLPEQRPDRSAPRPPGGVYARAWRIFKHPNMRISAGGTLLFGLLVGVTSSFYPVFLRDVTFTALLVGVLIAVRQLTSLLVRIGLPARIERYGARAVLLAGILVGGLSVMLVPFFVTFAPHVGLAILAGAGLGVMVPANLTLVHSGTPPAERGLANGIYGTALGLGTAVSAWAFGALGQAQGIAWTFWGGALTVGIGAVGLALFARARPAPVVPGPEPPEA